MDSVVHFEIPVDDEERATGFYHDVFDWQLDAMPQMHYTMVRTVETDEQGMPTHPGGINGGLYPRDSDGMPAIEHPVITIAVEDLDTTLERVREHGGEIMVDRFTVDDMGYGAYIRDPERNVIGVWEDVRR